ncbi:ATP-binding cassette domain-containing protein [Bifidobacterium pseudocatenulatum]|uniref:ATP-binding cassette domain-containing protein n=1 Tax=Bifidobacterium pseudocatenulatum TaxID=28026 RepID=UPI003A523023
MYCTANCLELKNVSFSYGDKEVLHSVSMSLKKGGQYAIVGPSGSGKTSIINIIP